MSLPMTIHQPCVHREALLPLVEDRDTVISRFPSTSYLWSSPAGCAQKSTTFAGRVLDSKPEIDEHWYVWVTNLQVGRFDVIVANAS